MKQHTTVTVVITVEYDDDVSTELQAQEKMLEDLPSDKIYFAEIVEGLVDGDGALVQPKSKSYKHI